MLWLNVNHLVMLQTACQKIGVLVLATTLYGRTKEESVRVLGKKAGTGGEYYCYYYYTNY